MKAISDKKMVLIIELTKEGTDPIEVSARADYTASSEGLELTRSLTNLEITTSEAQVIKSFGQKALQQIKAAEGIS